MQYEFLAQSVLHLQYRCTFMYNITKGNLMVMYFTLLYDKLICVNCLNLLANINPKMDLRQ